VTLLELPPLPKVDLGYEIYQATSLNETTNLYSFSNGPARRIRE
jgi:hypothetical protein